MTDYDVIICGLGPVGQLLALLLGDRGVRTLAIDREPEPYLLPRAAVIDDEVLRIFQSVGLDEAVLADAQVQPGASIITAAGRPVEIFRARTGRLGHPPLVSINQPAMERTMLAALAQRPSVDVRRGLTLEALDRRADRVDAFVRPTDGGPRERISRALAGRLRRRRQRGPGAAWRSRSRAAPTRSAGSSSTRSSTGRCARCRTRTSSATRAPDGDAADVARPPPLGVDAAPRRGRRAVPRAGRRARAWSSRGSTARASRSSAPSSTRSTRAWPRAGAAAACCWPATRRT